MKKATKSYVVSWAILFAVFNIIAFVSPGWINHEKYTASFWIGYLLITASFAGQLYCTLIALKEENLSKLFYKLPLIKISYSGLLVSFVVGGACMLLSPLPYWVGAIVSVTVLTITAISILKASAAAEIVAEIDEKVCTKTAFIRSMTVEAETLMSKASAPEMKTICKKVYEAFRYSDPMSSDALKEIEARIADQYAVVAKNMDVSSAEELLLLIAERNQKCKLLK